MKKKYGEGGLWPHMMAWLPSSSQPNTDWLHLCNQESCGLQLPFQKVFIPLCRSGHGQRSLLRAWRGARQDDMALNRTAKQDYKQTNGRCTWQLLWSPVGCMKEKKDHICMMSLMDLHLGYCHNYYIDKIKVLIHKFCRAAKSMAKIN